MTERQRPVMRGRCLFSWLLVLGIFIGCSKRQNPPPSSQPQESTRPASLIRLHFSGTARIKAETNAAPWVAMGELPASGALWQQTLGKLAKTPYELLTPRIMSTNDFAAIFRELITDATRAESFLEITGHSNRIVESGLAIRLSVDRAEFWRTNLLAILEDWTAIRAEPLRERLGWELKQSPNVFRLIRAGDWTLLGYGRGPLALQDEYLRRITESGRLIPTGGDFWLEFFLDGPNLPPDFFTLNSNRVLPDLGGFFDVSQGLPKTDLKLSVVESNLRIKGDLIFQDKAFSKPGAWQIPTNLIRDPIISFAAVRGLPPIPQHYLERLRLQPGFDANQLFVWAGAGNPMQTLAAVPVENADLILANLSPQLIARFNPLLASHKAGGLIETTNTSGDITLRWVGVPPFVSPHISTARDSNSDFVVMGTYANSPEANPPPGELFHHLARQPNLMYYDWELTGPRAWSWRNMINIFRHIFEKPRLRPETASIVWINSISNQLGNTVTQITRTDSNRLSLVRQGPVALTGMELMVLAQWLESPRFPLHGDDLSRRSGTNLPTSLPR